MTEEKKETQNKAELHVKETTTRFAPDPHIETTTQFGSDIRKTASQFGGEIPEKPPTLNPTSVTTGNPRDSKKGESE